MGDLGNTRILTNPVIAFRHHRLEFVATACSFPIWVRVSPDGNSSFSRLARGRQAQANGSSAPPPACACRLRVKLRDGKLNTNQGAT
jgi:hypothetical protein